MVKFFERRAFFVLRIIYVKFYRIKNDNIFTLSLQNKHLIFNSYETFIFFSYSVILFIITQLH